MRSAIEWRMDFKKSNGKLRKQFKSWKIPNGIERQHKIQDGDLFVLTLEFRGKVLFNDQIKIVSGVEIVFGRDLAKKIETLAKKRPGECIVFSAEKRETAAELESTFKDEVQDAINLDVGERHRRLKEAPKRPKRILVSAWVFERNPYVVAEVLLRAGNICGKCQRPAPFIRRTDKSPYLEVHHKKQLAVGGEDTVKNAIALCPNCHREAHFG